MGGIKEANQLRAVWAVVETYRKRHSPHSHDCEVCGLIRRLDEALGVSSIPAAITTTNTADPRHDSGELPIPPGAWDTQP